MDIRQTDPGGLRQRLSQVLAARPLLRGLLRALGAGGFCFVLAGAGLLDGPVPLALAPVCVLPFGPAAICAYLGAAAGYAVFWGLSAALEPVAAGFLLLAGVSPKFAAVLTTIPQCVLGGATVTVFSTIAMTGMKLIASQGLTARNTTVVGLSAALGVGVAQAGSALSQFPEEIAMILGKSPVVIATIMAVLLNLILPKETKE